MNKLVEKWPQVAALSAAVLLVLAVGHEWAFFWSYGIHWITLLTVRDYLNLCIHWLPTVLMGAAAFSVPFWLLATSWPLTLLRGHKLASIFFIVGMLAFAGWAIYYTYKTDPIGQYRDQGILEPVLIVYITSLLYYLFIIIRFNRPVKVSVQTFIAVLAFPCSITFIFMGYVRGTDYARKNLFPVQIENYDSSSLGIVKMIERGILLRDYDAKQTIFIPWSELKKIEGKKPGEQVPADKQT